LVGEYAFSGIWVASGPTNTSGLFDVKHVGLVVPRPNVLNKEVGAVFDHVGSVLLEDAHHGGAARASVEPNLERVRLHIALGCYEDVVQLLSWSYRCVA
jgi:hypothetical protein